ncbi:MAG: hypothetical protein V4574_22070 [Pseudomonadota bacterium]
MVQLARLQGSEGAGKTAAIGYATAAVMVAGTGEALALSLGADGSAFGVATIAGFLG